MEVTGTTKVAAVIGDPISHSRSPAIHNAAFLQLGIDWVFVAFRVTEQGLGKAVSGAKELGISGLSVTTPHKDAMVGLVDEISETARVLGAVNTVVFEDGIARGENTDGQGLVDALGTEFGLTPEGRRCAVIGAGGAARAIILALAQQGAQEVVVVNRSRERAESASALAGSAGRVGAAGELASCEIVVNATTVGMRGFSEGSPVPAGTVGAGQYLMDIVMNPPITQLMEDALEAGARVSGGAAMLAHQAAQAFRLWTGLEAPVEVMLEAVKKSIGK